MMESGESTRKIFSLSRCIYYSAFFLFCAAPPAQAQYMRSGLLSWNYDDFKVKTTEGVRETSGFSQSYAYSVDGPLGSPLVGEGGGSLNFIRGKSLSQTVTTSDANQKILAYSFHGNLLPPGLRRYITMAPSFSRTRTEQVWGSPPAARNLVDTNNALTLGLSLPRLPSFSVSNSHLRRRDPSAFSLVNQDTHIRTESGAYARGPLRLQYRRERSNTEDRLSGLPGSRTESIRADAELNLPEFGRLERTSLRASYQGEGSASSGAAVRQNSKTASAYMATKRFRTRHWESFLGYGGEYAQSSLRRADSAQNVLTLTSFSPLTRGRIDNRLAYLRKSGSEARQSVSDAATGEWRARSGKASLRMSADGSWVYDPAGGAALSDGLRQRLTLTPRPLYDVYGEAATWGARPLRRGSAGGSRNYSAGGGLGLHPAPATDLSGNYLFTRSRNSADGSVSLNRSLTAQAQSSPLETLKLAAAYSLTWSRDEVNGSSRGRMLSLTANYSPREGFDFSGEMTSGVRAGNLILNGSYTVGKTVINVRYQKQDSYSINGFANWNLSLSRYL